jgi:hypothetical protein
VHAAENQRVKPTVYVQNRLEKEIHPSTLWVGRVLCPQSPLPYRGECLAWKLVSMLLFLPWQLSLSPSLGEDRLSWREMGK